MAISQSIRTGVLAVLLSLLTLTATHLSATSCANPLPAGAVVTPDCTYIVRQYDPGAYLDQLGSYWVLVPGSSLPANVGKDPSVLRIGITSAFRP